MKTSSGQAVESGHIKACYQGKRRPVFLFDVDGTLVNAHRAGLEAFRRSIKRLFGWDKGADSVQYAGQTDLGILHALMQMHDLAPSSEIDQQFVHTLPQELSQTIGLYPPIALPGVVQLLDQLQGAGVVLGLLTGNVQACAYLKLSPVNLDHYFSFGAFGHEHPKRSRLAELAKERVRRCTSDGSEGDIDIFVVGDTPNDVAAAQAIGAPCIAVATGVHSAAELQSAGASYVFSDFSRPDEILGLLI